MPETIKERPILFSGPMVRAILAGTKTQTRRIAPIDELTITRTEYEPLLCPGELREFHSWFIKFQRGANGRTKGPRGISCSTSGTTCSEFQARQIIGSAYNPYGEPKERLWVRETWMEVQALPTGPSYPGAKQIPVADDEYPQKPSEILYRADCPVNIQNYLFLSGDCPWRPSIHMFRWASRLTLEIVSVRVERLQDITEADAIAEGIEKNGIDTITGAPYWKDYHSDHRALSSPIESYRSLWESINGPGSWDANPWVWVIEFRRLEATNA